VAWGVVWCWVLQRDERWFRLRICQPDKDAVAAMGARSYESWAPLADLADHHVSDIPYEL
jgi:hypothetical protein